MATGCFFKVLCLRLAAVLEFSLTLLTMGEADLRAETREKFNKASVMKIHGQPTHTDITKLEQELIDAAIHIPTSLGGGKHGHVGLICDDATYQKHSGEIPFICPTQPPALPPIAASQAENQKAIDRQFNENVRIYNTYLGVEQGIKDKIIEAVDSEYLLELKDELFSYHNVTAREMLDHLRKRGGGLDHTDILKIRKERDKPWDGVESPAVYFARVEKNIKLLTHVTPTPITTDMTERMMAVLSAFADTGNFNAAAREWEQKPDSEKTWSNIKVFINGEYCKAKKNGVLTAKQAGYGTANAMQAITEISTDQANLATNVFDALTEMKRSMEELKKSINHHTNAGKQVASTDAEGGGEKSYAERLAERQAERKKRWRETPVCKICNKKHPGVADDKCWELEANAANRKPGWKSNKSSSN